MRLQHTDAALIRREHGGGTQRVVGAPVAARLLCGSPGAPVPHEPGGSNKAGAIGPRRETARCLAAAARGIAAGLAIVAGGGEGDSRSQCDSLQQASAERRARRRG